MGERVSETIDEEVKRRTAVYRDRLDHERMMGSGEYIAVFNGVLAESLGCERNQDTEAMIRAAVRGRRAVEKLRELEKWIDDDPDPSDAYMRICEIFEGGE